MPFKPSNTVSYFINLPEHILKTNQTKQILFSISEFLPQTHNAGTLPRWLLSALSMMGAKRDDSMVEKEKKSPFVLEALIDMQAMIKGWRKEHEG